MKPDREGSGIERIAFERQRQKDIKRWSAGHDDDHIDHELALAACAYAAPQKLYTLLQVRDGVRFVDCWPRDWAGKWDKRPKDSHGQPFDANSLTPMRRIRQLEKAGALIAAEIDRLLRIQTKATK